MGDKLDQGLWERWEAADSRTPAERVQGTDVDDVFDQGVWERWEAADSQTPAERARRTDMDDVFDPGDWERWGAAASQTPAERAQAWLDNPVTLLFPEVEFMRELGHFKGRLGINATPGELVMWANGLTGGRDQLGVLGCALWSLSLSDWEGWNGLDEVSEEVLDEVDIYARDDDLRAAVVEAANAAFQGFDGEACERAPIEVERERLKACGCFFDRALRAFGLADDAPEGIDLDVGDAGVRALWREVLAFQYPKRALDLVREIGSHLEAYAYADGGAAQGPGHHSGATDWYDEHALEVARGMRTSAVVRKWDEAGPFDEATFAACGGEGDLGWAEDERGRLRQAAHGLVRRLWDALQMRVGLLEFRRGLMGVEDDPVVYSQRLLNEAGQVAFLEEVVGCGGLGLESDRGMTR